MMLFILEVAARHAIGWANLDLCQSPEAIVFGTMELEAREKEREGWQ